jgi:hypothetical protein
MLAAQRALGFAPLDVSGALEENQSILGADPELV